MRRIETKAYHGTTKAHAEAIIREQHFIESRKKNEWLGYGVYFFQYLGSAKWWITHDRYRGMETTVLEALLSYDDERLLDLDDPEALDAVEKIVRKVIEQAKASNSRTFILKSMSQREKMCAICNLVKEIQPSIKVIAYTFPARTNNTDFSVYTRNNKQICVSDPAIISNIKEAAISHV